MFKRHWAAILISIVLGIVPFFWLPPGAVDLGGDGGRLYFYDPQHLVRHLGPYSLWPQGTGPVSAPFSRLSFFWLLAMASSVVTDMHTLAALHNALKLIVGFLSVYAIVRLLLTERSGNKESWGVIAGAILGGLFYLFNPAMTENYVRALPSHDQVFLNPFMTYLTLRFLLSGRMRFAVIATTVSILFAHVYTYTGAPGFFAFYPLAVLFTIGFVVWVKRQRILWSRVALAILMFIGAHAFHLLPELIDVVDASNRTTSRVFSKVDAAEQLIYFVSVLPIPKVSLRWLAASPWMPWVRGSFVVPLVIIVGFLLSHRPRRAISLVGLFSLVTLFFATAKVSDLAIGLYKQFFLLIPGFSMFRNFYGQWQFVYFFFYALLFGVAATAIFSRTRRWFIATASILIGGFLVVRAMPFINGSMVNQKNHLSETNVAVSMDPAFAEMLSFIRTLPVEGKILILPFTDCCYEVIHGTNNGAYVGKSPVGYLTGKHDFAGYEDTLPFSETFWRLSRDKQYDGIKKVLGMLNIRYVLYNSDPKVYDAAFPNYPYEYVRKYLPDTQQAYRPFVEHIVSRKLFSTGSFELYEMEEAAFLPLFYASNSVRSYRDDPALSEYAKSEIFFDPKVSDRKALSIEERDCIRTGERNICALTRGDHPPSVSYRQINPTKYIVSVNGANKPYFLVMLMNYNDGWGVFMRNASSRPWSMVQLANNAHTRVNGYANAWYITPQDTGDQGAYELIIELKQQRIFYTGLFLSMATLVVSIITGFFVLTRQRRKI